MKGKKDPAPTLCAHFTGSYVGRCRAGVIYESVKDQSRREQLARFPCDCCLNSFITCERANFTPVERPRRRVDVSDRNWKRAIIYTPEKGTGQKAVRGQLVGCSDDKATAFIRIRPTPRRTRVIAVQVEQCHFERKKRGAAETDSGRASRGTGELPLFDLKEAPSIKRRPAHTSEVEEAA